MHTRNIGTLDCALVALAGGRAAAASTASMAGTCTTPTARIASTALLRRAVQSRGQRFVTVSSELQQWLIERVGIPAGKVTRICNGVDTSASSRAATPRVRCCRRSAFRPARSSSAASRASARSRTRSISCARSSRRAAAAGTARRCASLMIGDGPLRAAGRGRCCAQAGRARLRGCPGSRDDVAALHARDGRIRARLAARRNFEHGAGGDGERAARHRERDRRQSRTGRARRAPACWCRRAIRAALAAALLDYASQTQRCGCAHGRRARARAEQRVFAARDAESTTTSSTSMHCNVGGDCLMCGITGIVDLTVERPDR